MMEFTLKGECVELDNLLKACGFVENGAEAKLLIRDGKVLVNGVRETRVRRKLRPGDSVLFETREVKIA